MKRKEKVARAATVVNGSGGPVLPTPVTWYRDVLGRFKTGVVRLDSQASRITYDGSIRSDESHVKYAEGEELVHAVVIGLLHEHYRYPVTSLAHEVHFAHGSTGSKSDEVDVIVYDAEGLPFAMIEIKPAADFDRFRSDAIRYQLFGSAPLVGAPRLLIYATVEPRGPQPTIKCLCIDYTKYKSYESWRDDGEPHSTRIPVDFQDLDYQPYVNGGANDLILDSTQADFRSIALTFHNDFFGEHPDNTIFINLLKCLLAKIHDERTCRRGETYRFQVLYRNGKPDNAKVVFETVNALYKEAYTRYIDPATSDGDEINFKEFAEERVKTVVLALQGISITKGAARHGDIIGDFFEEILRSGFKQDRGMYFTHDNIARFMVEVLDLAGLTRDIWSRSNHPENRLPYLLDLSSGSGTFLLHGMHTITKTVKASGDSLVADHDAEQFYRARLSDEQPNYWAENFIYGFDPKFIMAIAAKVNMVLHGDGSAHIFKDDALRPLSDYHDSKFRPLGDRQRSVSRVTYPFDICESFDVVMLNPPFGITLNVETRAKLASTFSLPDTTPSEGLFLERCFQVLRPGGRLAIVLPESILNAKDLVGVRLFLYRFFNIKCVVSLPRNIFIDTPTLTSLVFAQKKTGEEIEEWDTAWLRYKTLAEECDKEARAALRKEYVKAHAPDQIASTFVHALSPMMDDRTWVLRSGKSASVLRLDANCGAMSGAEVAKQLTDFVSAAGYRTLVQSYIFGKVATELNYTYPTFIVEEVGYKLSKRKERARANDLCSFRGLDTGRPVSNLHLASEECEAVVNPVTPVTVLDHVRRLVRWS